MTRGLWILLAIGIAGMLALTLGFQATLSGLSGVEEAASLQEFLRSAYAPILAPEPPLRVYRVPRSEAWPGWRWKVEATLRPGKGPGSPDVARALPRIVSRVLATTAQKTPPSGAMILLHSPGRADANLLFDGQGRSAGGAGK